MMRHTMPSASLRLSAAAVDYKLEAVEIVVDILQQAVRWSTANRWREVELMPRARRLLHDLHACAWRHFPTSTLMKQWPFQLTALVLTASRWGDTKLMPGAGRLLHHLHAAGVRMAVATSTPRRTYERKMCGAAGSGVAQIFEACTCGDEVLEIYLFLWCPTKLLSWLHDDRDWRCRS